MSSIATNLWAPHPQPLDLNQTLSQPNTVPFLLMPQAHRATRCLDEEPTRRFNDPSGRSAQVGPERGFGATMRHGDVPAPTIQRLSLYLRQLEALMRQGVETVSSGKLGSVLGLTEAQVRKDLGYVGQFGRPGIGYRVEGLIGQVRHMLGTDRTWNALLVGAGRLGNALARYQGFADKGIRIVGVLDIDPRRIGQTLGPESDLVVRTMDDLESIVARSAAVLAIVCVPQNAAQGVADRLVAAGVRGILNFAPVALELPSHVALREVDLAVQLEQLSFQIGGVLEREN